MLRNILKTNLGFTLFTATDVFSQDNVNKTTKTEQQTDVSVVQNETGWERVRRMFQTDEFGDISNEASVVLHVGAMSLFVGACYGGITHSRFAYLDFMKNNQATVFHDHIEAKKKLQDAVTKSFGRGAWRWAWRLSLFCSSFVGISTTISVYRGKTGIIEYVAAGLISGSLYKFNMGPRGWIVGGGLGSVLGLLAGGATLGLLKLTGMSMDDVRYWQYHIQRERNNYLQKGMAEYLAKEEGGVILHHNQKMGEAGKSLESLEQIKENRDNLDKNKK